MLIETEYSIVSAGTELACRASPSDCHAVYEGLTHQKDIYTGIVFDWSQV